MWLWPALDCSGLDASGSVRELQSDHASEQLCLATCTLSTRAMAEVLSEGVEQVQRTLEAQLSRQHIPPISGLRHHRTHQVVGQQMHSNLLAHPLWGLAPETIHRHDSLDRTQIQLDLPALTIEGKQFLFMHLVGVDQGGHQSPTPNARFTQRQRLGHRGVGDFIHPLGAFRSGPTHHGIACTQALTTTEIRSSTLVLANHPIYPEPHQPSDHEVTRITTVSHNPIPQLQLLR